MPDSQPALDVTALMARLDNDQELLKELADIYFDEEPELLTHIRTALGAGDAEAVRRGAHSLKGAVSNFAAAAARTAAENLEMAGRAGDLALAAERLAVLDAELTRVRAALRSLLP